MGVLQPIKLCLTLQISELKNLDHGVFLMKLINADCKKCTLFWAEYLIDIISRYQGKHKLLLNIIILNFFSGI